MYENIIADDVILCSSIAIKQLLLLLTAFWHARRTESRRHGVMCNSMWEVLIKQWGMMITLTRFTSSENITPTKSPNLAGDCRILEPSPAHPLCH